MFAASTDSVEDNRKFAELDHYNFVLLSDPDKKVASALGVLHPLFRVAQRWTYVIDDQGVIRDLDKNVNPATAGQDLIKKLEALHVPPRKTRQTAPPLDRN